MGEGVEKLKALLRLSRTGSGSGSLRAGSGSGRPWTPKLGRGKVGVAEDKHLSFLRGAQWEQHPIYPLLAGGQVQLPGQRGGAGDDL